MFFGNRPSDGARRFGERERFTPYINTALIPYRSEVTQVSGDWQGFNPVLRIERLSFAAGYLQNVYIELDFFQTIANRKPIFRRFFVQKRRGWFDPYVSGLGAKKQK